MKLGSFVQTCLEFGLVLVLKLFYSQIHAAIAQVTHIRNLGAPISSEIVVPADRNTNEMPPRFA